MLARGAPEKTLELKFLLFKEPAAPVTEEAVELQLLLYTFITYHKIKQLYTIHLFYFTVKFERIWIV